MTTGRPGAAHLGLPFDVQKQRGRSPARRLGAAGPRRAIPAWRSRRIPPTWQQAAAALLSRATCPVFVCGGGVVIAGAATALAALAELLGAPVAPPSAARAAWPTTIRSASAWSARNGGMLRHARGASTQADLVVFVGCRAGSVTTERWRYPARGRAHHPHRRRPDGDRRQLPDRRRAGRRCEAGAAADSGRGGSRAPEAAGTPAPPMARHRRQGPRRQVRRLRARWPPRRRADPARARGRCAAIDLLPRDAIVVADPGTPCPYFSAYYELREAGRHFISNRAHGALGYSMSAGVGAHFGRPDAKIVSVMGDGSFGFTGGELETIVRLQVPLMMVVFSNSRLRLDQGRPEDRLRRALFLGGLLAHRPRARGGGLRREGVARRKTRQTSTPRSQAAAEHGGPALVDVIVAAAAGRRRAREPVDGLSRPRRRR